MCIVAEAEAVVADVHCRIACLRHRTYGDSVYHILLATAGNLLEQLVVAVGQCLTATYLHLETQLAHKVDKSAEFLGIRLVVNTVHERFGCLFLLFAFGSAGSICFAHAFCHIPVGQQHELFDEPVCLLLFLDIDPYGLGILIELEFDLLRLEIYGSVFVAFCTEYRCQLVKFQHRLVGFLLWLCALFAVFYYLLSLFVAVAAVAAYHRLAKPAAFHFCLVVHLEDCAEAQLVLVGTQ